MPARPHMIEISQQERCIADGTVALSARPTVLHDIIRQFTPSWFTVTMGTGILPLALNQAPFMSDQIGGSLAARPERDQPKADDRGGAVVFLGPLVDDQPAVWQRLPAPLIAKLPPLRQRCGSPASSPLARRALPRALSDNTPVG